MLVRQESKFGSNDLHVVFRPTYLSQLVGNNLTKKILNKHLLEGTLPHTLLFSGPAGCGKTTVARILALALNCDNFNKEILEPCLLCNTCQSILNQSNIDTFEINVGSSSGKDAINDIVKDLASSPFSDKYKIIIFDEAHKLTQGAKDLLLKVMEDAYSHVYLIFCSNEADKLAGKTKNGNPFLDRCNHFVLEPVDEDTLYSVLENISQFEGVPYNEDILHYISQHSKGIPRNAIVSLNSIITEGSWDLKIAKQLLGSIILDEEEAEIIELSRELLKASYKNSIQIFDKVVKKYGVESIRIAVCGYFVGCLKRARSISEGKRISKALDYLTVPIYLTGKPSEHVFYNVMFKVVMSIQDK